MKKTKIDWCDCTINPVIGCKNGCKYCYAEKINDRFKFIPCWKEPKFFEDRLKQLKSKKPKSVFMDSMSDIGWWENAWCEKVYNAMIKNAQHRYIFLTKCYNKIDYIYNSMCKGKYKVAFLGASVTNQEQLNYIQSLDNSRLDFLSIEPIMSELTFDSYCKSLENCKLFIIGAETGTRKDKVIPKKEWVDNIVKFCDENKIKVFMKESLREIMGNDFRQDKLLWSVE